MRTINIYPLQQSGVLLVHSMKDVIKIDPEYQRMGGIWNLEKRQLFIDSIINGFDIPKLYFHKFSTPKKDTKGSAAKSYAIIDGRQRLETIWDFIKGGFNLAEDFEFYDDLAIKPGGLSYADLAIDFPQLKLVFDQTSLPIICVETNDMDLIEEMFSRLNEAVTLNAAEKRNAFGGPMAKGIIKISNHHFFKVNIPFSNKRYQHREVAAKFLLLENSEKIVDTKKAFLDKLVKDYRKRSGDDVALNIAHVENILLQMSSLFMKNDKLLKTQGMVIIYFLVFKNLLIPDKKLKAVTRKAFLGFEELREKNRTIAEEDITNAKFELLEFDRASSQGINDAASIRFRYQIMERYIFAYLTGDTDGIFE